jgi:YggT family protein
MAPEPGMSEDAEYGQVAGRCQAEPTRLPGRSAGGRLASRVYIGSAMLAPFIEVILIVLDLIWWLIIASVVASWLVAFGVVNTRNDVVYRILDLLNRATDPILRPIRRLIPPMGGLDLSPMIVLLIIYVLQREIQIAQFDGYLG